MSNKELRLGITKTILEEIRRDVTEPHEKAEEAIWVNIRNKNALRLTYFGKFCLDMLGIENVELDIQDDRNVKQNLALILDLERIMDTPFYFDSQKIIFYNEDLANWFILCGQDVRTFLDTQKIN